MSDGNSSKYAGNPKAFVGENITVNSGTIIVDAKDDAFHANTKLEVNGGDLTIDTSDDAMHSDGDLTFNDGYLRVKDMSEADREKLLELPIGPDQLFELDTIKKFIKSIFKVCI